MSVVEYVPADRASTSLVIQDQFSNLRGESFSLPLSFPDACRLRLIGGRSGADGPNRVRRRTQIVGCHVGHRRGLPGRQSGELGRVGYSAGGGIRRESSLSCNTHAHLAADPPATGIDRVARSGVTRLLLVEQVQDVFGADEGPFRQQPVMLVGQRSAATHGDQSGVTVGGKDRHEFILSSARGDRHVKP
jgi:hypothetical protein